MNSSSTRSDGRRPVGKKSAVAAVLLIALYAFLQPKLNERFGWNLPGLKNSNSGGELVTEERPSDRPVAKSTEQSNHAELAAKQPEDETNVAKGPAASVPTTTAKETAAVAKLHYGLLNEISPDRFLSPQGLQYGPGSAEGHRLEHLRRHTKDQPSRAGKHGVFDGGMEGALVTIDNAYERAKKDQRTTKETDRDRTIYTIDMGGRVGYVGGREGNRRRKPMARRVKLVLEGTQFITAYPL